MNDSSTSKRSRDGAVSPSAISTASSAAPLVRSGSATSKASSSSGSSFSSGSSSSQLARPKTTRMVTAASIAAAQLQCQRQLQQQQCSMAKHHEATNNNSKNSKPSAFPAIFSGKNKANQNHEANNGAHNNTNNNQDRHFGYETGKTIAYNAHRFNSYVAGQFRTINKAYLLTILICLATIFSLSLNSIRLVEQLNAGQAAAAAGTRVAKGSLDIDKLATNAKLQPTTMEPTFASSSEDSDESLDSLDSQPLVASSNNKSAPNNHQTDASESSDYFDGFDQQQSTTAPGQSTSTSISTFNSNDDGAEEFLEPASASSPASRKIPKLRRKGLGDAASSEIVGAKSTDSLDSDASFALATDDSQAPVTISPQDAANIIPNMDRNKAAQSAATLTQSNKLPDSAAATTTTTSPTTTTSQPGDRLPSSMSDKSAPGQSQDVALGMSSSDNNNNNPIHLMMGSPFFQAPPPVLPSIEPILSHIFNDLPMMPFAALAPPSSSSLSQQQLNNNNNKLTRSPLMSMIMGEPISELLQEATNDINNGNSTAANSTITQSINNGNGKMIIRKDKNGATIIISSRSSSPAMMGSPLMSMLAAPMMPPPLHAPHRHHLHHHHLFGHHQHPLRFGHHHAHWPHHHHDHDHANDRSLVAMTQRDDDELDNQQAQPFVVVRDLSPSLSGPFGESPFARIIGQMLPKLFQDAKQLQNNTNNKVDNQNSTTATTNSSTLNTLASGNVATITIKQDLPDQLFPAARIQKISPMLHLGADTSLDFERMERADALRRAFDLSPHRGVHLGERMLMPPIGLFSMLARVSDKAGNQEERDTLEEDQEIMSARLDPSSGASKITTNENNNSTTSNSSKADANNLEREDSAAESSMDIENHLGPMPFLPPPSLFFKSSLSPMAQGSSMVLVGSSSADEPSPLPFDAPFGPFMAPPSGGILSFGPIGTHEQHSRDEPSSRNVVLMGRGSSSEQLPSPLSPFLRSMIGGLMSNIHESIRDEIQSKVKSNNNQVGSLKDKSKQRADRRKSTPSLMNDDSNDAPSWQQDPQLINNSDVEFDYELEHDTTTPANKAKRRSHPKEPKKSTRVFNHQMPTNTQFKQEYRNNHDLTSSKKMLIDKRIDNQEDLAGREFLSDVSFDPFNNNGPKSASLAAEEDSSNIDQANAGHFRQPNQYIGDIPMESSSTHTSHFFGLPQDSNHQHSSKSYASMRQPRGFTFHSNNQVAGSFLSKSQARDQHKIQARMDSMEARGHLSESSVDSPPTDIVMGRRLDDGPLFAMSTQ